jgi:ATP-dependent Lhr-like helicase
MARCANADELHDALVWLGFLTEAEVAAGEHWRDWLDELAAAKRAGRIETPGGALWISAERAAQFRAVFPEAKITPKVGMPDRGRELTRRGAGRDHSWPARRLGPGGDRPRSRSRSAFSADAIAAPLAALETEGFAMRGRFTPGASEEEWCERRLLSRIHHYTIKRLRAEIEPVAARDFLRFLFAWQHVAPDARMAGPKALDTVLAQTEGFEASAPAWEEEILPARVADYDPDWLDEKCLAGHLTWMRLRPRTAPNGKGKASPVRTTPMAILPRRHSGVWTSLSPQGEGFASAHGQVVLDYIRQNGASFFPDLVEGCGLLRAQAEEALAELVALGLVTSDAFVGLRALLVPSSLRRTRARRRRRSVAFGIEDAGRWSLVRRGHAERR